MTVCDCPHCTSGTKMVIIAALNGRVTFRFPPGLASCECELTVLERLQMVIAAAQETVTEVRQHCEPGPVAAE